MSVTIDGQCDRVRNAGLGHHSRSAWGAVMGAAAFVTCTLYSAQAAAVNFEVEGDVAAQGYEVASPWGDIVLGRRRLTSMLALSAHNLQGDYKPFEADYSVRLRLRVDADFGVDGAEEDFNRDDPSRFVPGFDHSPIDLMYGYVEGRNLAGGLFGFKLGRQYVTDVLGWWSFDGGLVRITTPFFMRAELYGGLEQRGGLPLSTSRFESQGVWRGSHSNLNGRSNEYPSFQFAGDAAPAFGFALESDGPNWAHGRFTYRRVYNTGEFFTQQFPSPGGGGIPRQTGQRLSSEKIGYALSAYLNTDSISGGIRGGFVYDVYNDLISKAYGTLDLHVTEERRVSFGLDADFFVPTFDADSIWNWFTHNAVSTFLGRVAVKPIDEFEVTASGGVRLWMADGDPETYAAGQCASLSSDPNVIANCQQFGSDPSTGADEDFSRAEDNRATQFAPDLLANLGARYRWSSGEANLRGMLQTGFGGDATNRGRRTGGRLSGQQMLSAGGAGVFYLGAGASLYNWNDPLRDDRDAVSFGYTVGPEWRPWDVLRTRVEWEHNMNRLVGQRFRILGLVNLRVMP